ncbi:MAG: hypothetical protein ABJF10_25770 [Chthoniobacter sp.]|uniref:hypothetical protein n=1 Tax=Chthoniobacter sp. TaxID=2510640 RepID=UPI0032AD2666
MKRLLLPALLLVASLGSALAADYKAVPDWYSFPDGKKIIGNMHGDVAVASNGEVYVSVMDPKAGLQVFGPDGKWLRNVPNAPADFHGFVIHKEAGGEFIYGPRLGAGNILKLTLDGKEVLNIPPSAIPDEFKSKTPKTKKGADGKDVPNPDADKPVVRLTAMDVAPNGDLYVTDGYSSDYVHRFDKTGKYLKSFGGKQPPYSFKTLHKIAIDTRFDPPRIIGCDRANGRVVHMSLDGDFLGVIISDLRLPAAVAVQGDLAVIGELKGRVTVIDKAGKIVTQLGDNTNPAEQGTNKVELDQWRPGIVTAPHGVAFNAHGDIFVSEYNIYGRIHRFDRQ